MINNSDEPDYPGTINRIAKALTEWQGPIVIAAHKNPDGDALGSALTLKRALETMGKHVLLPIETPPIVRFLPKDGELCAPLDSFPDNTLLVVLDISEKTRTAGVPLEKDAFPGVEYVINMDHHGTNDRFGDIHCVQPSGAATSILIKDLIDALGVAWTQDLAEPCMVGILTDTGVFQHANTNAKVLETAAELIGYDISYAELICQLEIREPAYFRMLGEVLSTVAFHFDGRVAMVSITQEMVDEVGPVDDDSNDYIGRLRYAKGVELAILLRAQADQVKISLRSQGKISAQAIAIRLGGGGHVNASGAEISANMKLAQEAVLQAVQDELAQAH